VDAARRARLNDALGRLKRGERAAADEVFALLWPVLKAFAARWLSGSAHVEDVAQQALLKVFSQVAAYDTRKDALTWALEVTVWECRTERRRVARSRADGWSDAAARVPGPSAPEEEVAAAELSRALAEVVSGLSERDRAEVARVVAEETAGDAAARKRRQRALERLRRLWRAFHGEG
jgi:RNA polymerase sigma-70 factor (ECF subfamily)